MQWKHATSPSPQSSRCRHQLPRLFALFLGCWRCTDNWLYASQRDSYRGLLTYFTNWIWHLNRSGEDNAPTHRSHAGQAALIESIFEEMCHPPNMASSELKWLASISKFEETFDRDFRSTMRSSTRLKSGWKNSFYSTGIKKNFEIAIICALTKAVMMLKNNCIFIHLSFV